MNNMVSNQNIIKTRQYVLRKTYEFDDLIGKRIVIIRKYSRQGLFPYQCQIKGKLVSITESLVVIEREDLLPSAGSDFKQHVTFTFSDFITGLYDYEVL